MAIAPKILIADDEVVFLKSTADLLRREGFDCDTAPDGSTAARMLATTEYSLLISDIRMPDNLDMAFIRSLPHKGLPVILVTGYPSLETAVLSIELPVVAYLVKPVEFSVLLSHVRSAITRHQIYCTVRETQERLANWSDNMKNLRALMEGPSDEGRGLTVKTFLASALRNIFGAVEDIAQLIEALPIHNEITDPTHLLRSPRMVCLEKGLEETVKVLQATKRSFKSKEIADLRKKLEALLENQNTTNGTISSQVRE